MDCFTRRLCIKFLCQNCSNLAAATTSVQFFSSAKKLSPLLSEESRKLYEDLDRRINKFKQQLVRNNRASFLSRSASNSLFNLRQARSEMKEKEKKLDAATVFSSIPAIMTLEVLSNGTAQMQPCFAIKTPYKVYLFNCPEGTSRFMASLRLKPNVLNDIFITRATWDNFGGISSILLLKQERGETTRIHGTVDVRHFFECLRPFADADCPSVKYPAHVEERSFELGTYSDPALKVHYLPMMSSRLSSSKGSSPPYVSSGSAPLPRSSLGMIMRADVAYLIELADPPRRVDASKLIELGIPNGPLIAKLKDGFEVTLSDGRIVKPEQVLFSEISMEQPSILVVDCSDLSYLQSLCENSTLQKFVKKEKSLTYCVHFTPKNVFETAAYAEWMASFGELCSHIVLNGTGPCLPHIESVHRNQALLNAIAPSVYPALKPDFRGVISQEDVCERKDNIWRVRPLQRFNLRGKPSAGDANVLNLTEATIMAPAVATENAKVAVENYKKFAERNEESREGQLPMLSFLGTSSAVPSKYRNVSGYLLRINENSNILVDCGEGTYGQMRVLFGDEQCSRMLTNLNAIFITHAHQDHMNGLYTVILRRQEAFLQSGLEYRPLILVCNPNIIKPLQLYSRCFSNLEPLVCFVNTYKKLLPSVQNTRETRSRLPDEFVNMVFDVTGLLPKGLYNASTWGLRSVVAVQVHHTRMANGFVFTLNSGHKVVFSGDTKPCDLLVKHGAGADVLVHESTFEDGHERDAAFKKHSTMKQAVDVGTRMAAKHIILSHFSARYPKVPALPDYLDKAGNISVAMDNLSVSFNDLHLLPKLLPVFRELYQEELFEIQMRLEQRQLRQEEEAEELNRAKKLKKEGQEPLASISDDADGSPVRKKRIIVESS